MSSVRLRLLVAISCIFLVSPTGPATAAQTETPPDTKKILLQPLRGFKEQYVGRLLSVLKQYAAGRTYIDKETIDRHQSRHAVRIRAGWISRTYKADLNGDGQVSRKEFETSLRADSTRPHAPLGIKAERQLEQIFEADANGDGILTIQEVVREAVSRGEEGARSSAKSLLGLYALDPNKDGVLTVDELRELAAEKFDEFDKDKDGRLDQSESQAVRKALRDHERALRIAKRIEGPASQCKLPVPGKHDKVILLSAFDGHAISTISVTGPSDVTVTGRLIVEPGKEPIYLVVSSTSNMIWKIDGAKERLAKLVVIPQKLRKGPGAGVVGLPADRVVFLDGVCRNYLVRNPPSSFNYSAKKRAIIENQLGRKISKVMSVGLLEHVFVPSGRRPNKSRYSEALTIISRGAKNYLLTPNGEKPLHEAIPHLSRPPRGVDRGTWSKLHWIYPGGVVKYEANDVRAPGPVRAYDVLPQQAGLVQLMESGAIRRLRDGYYLIQEPIARFPPGSGEYGAKFMLAKGVPMPLGWFGQLCVKSEETGQLVAGPRSRC